MKTCIVVLLVLAGCASDNYDPSENLSPLEQDKLVSAIIRYVGKRPDKANDTTKFDERYNEHYNTEAAKYRLTRYYRNDEGEHFFLLVRRAPSMYEKYVATGGRFRVDGEDSLVAYEEIFRTWKLVPDTLQKRSYLLFDLMVKKQPLDSFYTRHSKGVEFIEFPDENVYYDTVSRNWKSRLYGSVEELVGVD